MKNYIKAQFTFVTKGLIYWVWVYSFAAFFVATGIINIYRSTFDGRGWFSAGVSDILFALLYLLWCFSMQAYRKQRGLFADIFKGWDAMLEDNKRLIETC